MKDVKWVTSFSMISRIKGLFLVYSTVAINQQIISTIE